MEHVQGIEIGVGAYFNGMEFLMPACIDWEHKRFFPGDLGERTGEMGTVVSYRGSERLMEETLSQLAPRLRSEGYCGYINLNTIVNESGIWPLEFTARFGYPGTAILGSLQQLGWGSLFKGIIDRSISSFATLAGFAVGVVLTVPPFPYRPKKKEAGSHLPISFSPGLSKLDQEHIHFWEVARQQDQLLTAGILGQVMVVTGVGQTASTAQHEAYKLARRVIVPNLRYRNDIGTRLITSELSDLLSLGLFALSDFDCPP